MTIHFEIADLRLMLHISEENSMTRGAEASHLKTAEHLSTIGILRIAVVYQDNAFGKAPEQLPRELPRRTGPNWWRQYRIPWNLDGAAMAATRVKALPRLYCHSHLQ